MMAQWARVQDAVCLLEVVDRDVLQIDLRPLNPLGQLCRIFIEIVVIVLLSIQSVFKLMMSKKYSLRRTWHPWQFARRSVYHLLQPVLSSSAPL